MTNPLYDALFAPNRDSDRDFLRFAAGDSLTHNAFADMCDALAAFLIDAGVTPGDRVAAQVEKSAASLAIYGACVRIGAVFLPLNTAYSDEEVAFFLGDCSVKLFFCDPERAPTLEGIAKGLGAKVATMAPDGSGPWQGRKGLVGPDPVAREDDDLAAMLYTSGTTGRPKGAMLSHRNLLSNAITLADLWGMSERDVLLHALPIYHSHGLFVAGNLILLRGAQMIWLPRFDAGEVQRLMSQATLMMGVPTFYTRLLADPAFGHDVAQNMRLFISGSAPLLSQTHNEFSLRTGHKILERYGLTETSMNCSNPLDGDRRAGTVGRPLPGVDLRISQDGDEIGEIQVRGPNVFKGYWGLEEKTAEAFTPDGWFRTGDLGQIDDDGYLSIVGRSKDLVITGGLNVYPKEVETLIDAIEGVEESAVFGLPDADFGERIIAAVVPKPGHYLDLDIVKKALSGRLARFKQPKHWHLVDALPRNAMGKVRKEDLRARFGAATQGVGAETSQAQIGAVE